MGSLNPVSGNPNAVTSLVGGVGGGQIVLNIAKAFGWNLSAGWAITVAGVASYVLLYVGREGLAGVWSGLKHGFKKPAGGDAPPPAK